MRPTVRTAAVVILLCALTRNLGYLASEVYELISLVSFFILALQCLPFHRGRPWPAALTSILAAAALLVLFKAVGEIPRIVLIGGVLFAVPLDGRKADGEKKEASVLALVTLLFGLYVVGIQHSSFLWHLTDRFSKAYSSFLGGLAAKNLLLSASASGFHICALLFFFYISFFCVSGKRNLLLLVRGLPISAALMGAFMLAGSVWEKAWQSGEQVRILNHYDFQPLLVLAALGIIWLESSRAAVKAPATMPNQRKLIATVAGALALCASIVVLTAPEPGKTAHKRVLLFDKGQVMWGTPIFGWYGDKSGGMFGNLPRYLEFRGFEARRDTISSEILKDTDLIVAINLAKPFTDAEQRLTWEFVEQGGGLLALGDHTGLGAIREPFNALLRPVGIEFAFDSAKGFPESWVDGMEWRSHETTRVIEDENSTQIWTGASLAVGWEASPLILGKFAWSDSGDVDNEERAYLGNFTYGQGELLGDVVLVAAARYGRGKVLVFGDTSTFQNGALVSSDEFAHGCLQWLCERGQNRGYRLGMLVVGLSLLAAAAILTHMAGSSRFGVFSLTLALLASPVLSAFAGLPPARAGSSLEKVAFVDKSHGEQFDLYSWGDDSIGGLIHNLMRNGFLPFLHSEFSQERLAESRFLMVMGPTRDFSATEIELIDGFVRKGNILLVSMGHAQYGLAPSLMRHFGFSVRNTPLGRVETEGLAKAVRFYDAYPVESASSDTTVFCKGYGFPLAVMRDWGEGRVVAMGDTRFFQNKNLEHREEFIEENVMFLKELFAKLDRDVYDKQEVYAK